MASKIKVDNIANQADSNIVNKCGTDITLGASGDTITLACGASQTGFGRTGTVNWDTTAKTASFTAVSGNGYFVNTTSGAITVTMPASPSAGDIVGIKDYAGTFETNNVTVARNGSNFDGVATDPTLSTNQLSVFFVYVDGTQGWKTTQNDSVDYGALYVTATGGTETTCGDYKIHTFTGPGTFTVTCAGNPAGSSTVDYLVVAGGGGGGDGAGGSVNGGGGGGAGGYRESSGAASGCYTTSPLGNCVSALPVSVTGYPVTIGAGGTTGTSGSNSVFTGTTTITSAGGGKGGNGGCAPNVGAAGGSGGGHNTNPGSGSAGNTPPVSPPQGNPGGSGLGCTSGGGGGATAAGSNANPGSGGTGGTGATSSINGTPTTRAAGGAGTTTTGPAASPQAANTGNGGGGSGYPGRAGGTGGSGIVIIRYKYQN